MIDQDYELPVQITASPVQTLHCGVRSLEEELQEAIQKAQVPDCRKEEIGQTSFYKMLFKYISFFWPQLDPPQSIDDILDEPLICLGEYDRMQFR